MYGFAEESGILGFSPRTHHRRALHSDRTTPSDTERENTCAKYRPSAPSALFQKGLLRVWKRK
jgi:hypothetical protein